jgi:hypothetical protein
MLARTKPEPCPRRAASLAIHPGDSSDKITGIPVGLRDARPRPMPAGQVGQAPARDISWASHRATPTNHLPTTHQPPTNHQAQTHRYPGRCRPPFCRCSASLADWEGSHIIIGTSCRAVTMPRYRFQIIARSRQVRLNPLSDSADLMRNYLGSDRLRASAPAAERPEGSVLGLSVPPFGISNLGLD